MSLKTLPLGSIASDLTFRQTLVTYLNLFAQFNPKHVATLSARPVVMKAQTNEELSVAEFVTVRRLIAYLLAALNRHVPLYTYLGYHPSDHGNLGVWVDLEALHRAEAAGKVSQAMGADWSGIKSAYVLDMTGAGLTLYRRKGRVTLWATS